MRACLLLYLLVSLPAWAQHHEPSPAPRPTVAPESRQSEAKKRGHEEDERTREQLKLIQDFARLSKPEPKPSPKSKDTLKQMLKWSERETSRETRLQALVESIFARNSEVELAIGQRRRTICPFIHGYVSFERAAGYARLVEAGDEEGCQKHANEHAARRQAGKEFVVVEIYDMGLAKVRFLDEARPVYAHVLELKGWAAIID